MKQPSAQAGAQEDSESSQSLIDRNRKRKRLTRQTSTTSNTSATAITPGQTRPSKAAVANQKTIQGLFAGQPKPTVDRLSPESKKARKSQTDSEATPQRVSSTSQPPQAMYTFPSKFDTQKAGAVDLTKSPRARRPSNAANLLKTNFNPNTGAKKLVVKNLKPQSTWDANSYLEQTWRQLDAALTTIFAEAPITFSMEDMYRGVENLCRQGRARNVYEKLAERCRSHINKTVKASLLAKNRQNDVEVLQDVLAAWSSWNSQIVCCLCITNPPPGPATALTHDL